MGLVPINLGRLVGSGGRNYNDGFASNGPQIAIDTEIEFYLFVDKEKFITCTIPPISTRLAPAVTYIGALGGINARRKT